MNRSVEQWAVSKRAVASEAGVVAAQHHEAARAGAAMLHAGGNAIDAAVATAFALCAVEPWMCGLGGSGYMVVWSAAERTARVIDFQGMLPAAITFDDYPLDPDGPDSLMGFPAVVDRQHVVGYRSITVPGAVKGLSHALGRFGTLGLDTILSPAITLADRGLAADWFTTLQVSLAMADLARDPAARAVYLPDGGPPRPESFLALGALPDTLRALADGGAESFYRGALAERLAADLQAGGSRIDEGDLAAYEALEHGALTGEHRSVALHTAGPTSGGPRLVEAFGHIAAHLDTAKGIGPESWAVYADALDAAWRSHNIAIGRAKEVGGCTSHMSAVDAEGNMVALTYTLLNRFGSCVVLPSTGILMNNSVSYFDPRPGYPTSMAGHKRINASNMCPTIAERDGKALFAVGASGANQIMPAVLQVAALMLDFGLTLEEAFNHPRIDATDRGSVRVDPALGEAVLAHLATRSPLEVAQRLVFPKLYACPSGVSRDPASGLCHGINDPSQPIGGAAAPAPFAPRVERDPAAGALVRP
ncbi:gamma-glutamyltransferase [Acuticoccus sp. M5D2P5]|uniref:gamma-glutamyltransferase family protein n=1 Tax=Acuticoccus kalidii TaxID=2910977 RepID=UPI001F3C0EB6|nr:gamma-glutamyltransferase [Acuticoccus kalidii]MCF3933610.1 gamma-glutamyltransferase [Acuticoccus kalidii]